VTSFRAPFAAARLPVRTIECRPSSDLAGMEHEETESSWRAETLWVALLIALVRELVFEVARGYIP
jgi:hypothetical protein